MNERIFELIKRFTTPRLLFLDIFIFCIVMMVTARVYFQYYLELEPCPLCTVQRVFVVAVGVIALIAFLHGSAKPFVRKLYAGFALLWVIGGLLTAWRHLWLQSLPKDQLPECGPGLDYLMEVFSYAEVLREVFTGSGECGETMWSFLGLTIPAWTMVGFLILAAMLIYQLVRKD